jgi:hypothetical protein
MGDEHVTDNLTGYDQGLMSGIIASRQFNTEFPAVGFGWYYDGLETQLIAIRPSNTVAPMCTVVRSKDRSLHVTKSDASSVP